MKTNLRNLVLWIVVPLLFLPLRAQEPPAEPPPAATPPAATPPAADQDPEPVENLDPDERVSADNNLTFPVDI